MSVLVYASACFCQICHFPVVYPCQASLLGFCMPEILCYPTFLVYYVIFHVLLLVGQVHRFQTVGKLLTTAKDHGTQTLSWTQNINRTLTMRDLLKASFLLVKTLSQYGIMDEQWHMDLLSVRKDSKEYVYERVYSY